MSGISFAQKLTTMKTIITLAALAGTLLFGAGSAQAQSYTTGTNALNLGVGFGYSIAYGGGTATPVLSASFEHGFAPLGPGIVGGGAVFSYQGNSWSWTDGYGDSYHEKWRTMLFGIRGTWHPDVLVGDKYDVYGGVQLGYYHYAWTYTESGPYVSNYHYENPLNSHIGIGLVAGGRYYFTNAIGIFGEVGYDISYLKLGLTVKL